VAQGPFLTFAVGLELLDDLANVFLVRGRWRTQHRHGLAPLRDKDLFSFGCPLQKLGQVSFCLERTKFRHGPSYKPVGKTSLPRSGRREQADLTRAHGPRGDARADAPRPVGDVRRRLLLTARAAERPSVRPHAPRGDEGDSRWFGCTPR